jgi:hypothetical protein
LRENLGYFKESELLIDLSIAEKFKPGIYVCVEGIKN